MYIDKFKKIVIKIGSSILIDKKGKPKKIWLSEFAKDMTIIMITHRIPSLSNCNKIYKLDHGKLHEITINKAMSNSLIDI